MDTPFDDPTGDVEVVPLDDYLDWTGRPIDLVDPHAWQVNDDGAAEWAMGKLRRLRDQAAEITARAKAYRDPIDEWEARALRQLNPGIAYFEGRLIDYLRAIRAASDRPEDKRPKTHAVPSGRVWSKAGGLAVTVDDLRGFIAWALVNERYDLLAIKPDLAKLRACARQREDGTVAVVADGEPIPGVSGYRKERSWGVTPAGASIGPPQAGPVLATYPDPRKESQPPSTVGTGIPTPPEEDAK